jgi:hypothetical protein
LTSGVLGLLASMGVIGVTGAGLETLETFIGRIPLVGPSLTRGAQRFVNPNRKMQAIRSDRLDHGEQEAQPSAERRIPRLERDAIGLNHRRALGSLIEHDLRANAFRVCREGKPVSTPGS